MLCGASANDRSVIMRKFSENHLEMIYPLNNSIYTTKSLYIFIRLFYFSRIKQKNPEDVARIGFGFL